MKYLILLFVIFSFVGCYDDFDPKAPRESTARKWTDGRVYYKWHSSVDEDTKNTIVSCMMNFEDISSLQFIEHDSQRYFVTIMLGDKNSCSNIGMHKNLKMIISTKNIGIIKHELGHIIGLEHEHQREDRDKYIKINWKNIKQKNYNNFIQILNHLIPENIFKYDKYSIMHYNLYSFSKNKDYTIEFKREFDFNIIYVYFCSQKNTETKQDIQKIQYLYPL